MASSSWATSSAGISTEISRLTPSLFASAFLASVVSVGLTFSFRIPLQRRGWTEGPAGKKARFYSHTVNLECKEEGRAASNEERGGVYGRQNAPSPHHTRFWV